MRVLKWIGILFIPIILLLGAGVAYWLTMDTAALRDQLTKYASQQLHRTLTISGELKPGFSLANGFSISIKNATLANVEGWQPAHMLKLDSLDLTVDPFAFMRHRVHVKSLSVVGADAYFEQRGKANNWQFVDEAAEEKTVAAKGDAPKMEIAIDDVTAENVRLTHIADGARKVYEIKDMALSAGTSSPLSLKLDAVADGQAVRLSLKAGSLDEIQSGASMDINADLNYGPHAVTADGVYRRNGDEHSLSKAKLNYNGLAVTGDIAANMAGKVPSVRADIVIPELDIAKFGAPDGGKGGQTAPGSGGGAGGGKKGPLFSRDPLPWDTLNAANADVQVDIKKLRDGDKNYGPANLQAALKNGSLNANVVTQPPGARQPVTLKVAASASKNLRLNVAAPALEPTLLLGDDPVVQAPASFNLSVSGSGSSLHDIASTANGEATLKFQPGTLNVEGLPPLVSGTLGSLVGMDKLDGARMACAMADFGIANGVATVRGIGFDSAVAIAAGEGSINLGAETANLRFVAEPIVAAAKGARFPVYIKGALSGPVTTVDTAAITGQVANAAAGKAIKLIGDDKIAGIADQLLGASKKNIVGYISMPKNPCRPNDVDAPPPAPEPAAATTQQQPTTVQGTIQQHIEQRVKPEDRQKIEDVKNLLGGFGIKLDQGQ